DETAAVDHALADRNIKAALQEKIDLSLSDVSLRDAVEQIRRRKDLNLLIDQESVKAAGIDPNTTVVSVKLSGKPLDSALRVLLQPLELTTVIEDEVLKVTTKDKAAQTLDVKLYPIGDLVDPALAACAADDAADSPAALIDCITSTVAPASWSCQGGIGNIESYLTDQPLLIVSQTEETHQQLARFMTQLRDVLRKRKG